MNITFFKHSTTIWLVGLYQETAHIVGRFAALHPRGHPLHIHNVGPITYWIVVYTDEGFILTGAGDDKGRRCGHLDGMKWIAKNLFQRHLK